MSVLEDIRDETKAHIATAQTAVTAATEALLSHNALLSKVEAEIARVPSMADVKALVDKIPPP